MKTVKSTEELKRLALARGAGASFSGGKFNIGASKVSPIRQTPERPNIKPDPAPEAPKEPEVKEVVKEVIKEVQVPADMGPVVKEAVDAMAQAVGQVAADNARVMQEVANALKSASEGKVPEAEGAKRWRLKVNRDTRGFMDTVDIVRVE